MQRDADTPAGQRRIALRIYALAAPIFLASMLLLGDGRSRPGPILLVTLLFAAGALWLLVRPRPRSLDWIVPMAVVPVAACGIAYATCGPGGAAYLVILTTPLAWASVHFEARLVAITFVSTALAIFIAIAARAGPGAAAMGTLVLAPVGALTSVLVFGAADRLRRTRAELQLVNERDRAALRAMPDLILRLDREGRVLAVHGPPDALLVAPPEQLAGRRLGDLFPAELAKALEWATALALDSGELQTVHHELDHGSGRRAFEARIAPSGPDEVIVVRRDVTRERAAERQLEVSRRQLALAVEGSHLGYWDWEVGSGRLHHGPLWPELLGYAAEEIPATFQDWGALAHPDDAARVEAHLVAHLKGQVPGLDAQYRMRAKDGRWRWIHTRGKVVERGADRRALRLVGTHADVTWLREAQERLSRAERLASVTTLVRGLAHEMNNPLASLMANLDYLGEELGAELNGLGGAGAERSGELRQALLDACESGRRVGGLVADLKTFTAIGEPPAHPPGPLRTAVEEALRLAQVQLDGAEVVVEVPEALSVELGHAELLQVLAALLMNAGQAGGGRPNRVRVRAEPSGAGRVALRVSDTGAGMDPATLAHAFEPFFTTRGVGGGRGLGLSVCLGIVEGAGGEIRLESQPGEGTVAHLDLPAALPGRPA